MRVDYREQSYARVFLRGVDISQICLAADDDEKWADVLVELNGHLLWKSFSEVLSTRIYNEDIRIEVGCG